MPNPNWAWLPLLFGVAWLTVAVALPDKKLPALRRFAPQMREHPKSPGMIFMVIPVRNDSLTTELLQVSAFLRFKRGLFGPTIYVHDALWFEWYPEYGDRQIRRNETRHVVVAVGWGKNSTVKDQPPLAVGFEHELKKPEPKSLREKLQRARWTSAEHEVAMEDLCQGKWKVNVRIIGYKYSFQFTQKIIVDGEGFRAA